jgi:signal peptidase I
MFPFFSSRRSQLKKQIEHALFCVKYARRMKEDLLSEKDLRALRELQQTLKSHLKAKTYEEGAKHCEEAIALSQRLHPAPGGAYALRENIEVFVVVLAVALGIRTYFLQPYQIPTGSMQPTLYGVTAVADYKPDWTDKIPARWVKFALTGSRYKEIRAKTSGIMPFEGQLADTFRIYDIAGRNHKIHQDFEILATPGKAVAKGQVIARGLLKQGDHIIVNRFITNFVKPKRGDIVVFSTRGLPIVRSNSAYIKRLVGVPGDTLSICEGKLVVNGDVLREPDVFVRQYEGAHYPGYRNPTIEERRYYLREFGLEPRFHDCNDKVTLGKGQYMMMGDNTARSLDGRFFGATPAENIIGIGFFVPWPFVQRGIYNGNAGPVR